MALIKTSAAVSAISGKSGGNVFARNRAGAYMRSWAKPTNAPTDKQTLNRARFGEMATRWTALDNEQRERWANAAVPLTRANRLGDIYSVDGRQAFLQSNNQLVAAGEYPISDPPANFDAPSIASETGATAATLLGVLTTLTIQTDLSVPDTKLIVEATAPQSGQKQNQTNVYRQIGTFAEASPLTILSQYIAAYGNGATPGQVIFFRLRVINTTNGVCSPALNLTEVITGT